MPRLPCLEAPFFRAPLSSLPSSPGKKEEGPKLASPPSSSASSSDELVKNSSVRLPLDPPRRLLRSRRHPFLCIVRSQDGSPPFPPAVKQDPSRNPPSPVSTADRIQPGRRSRRGADLLRVTKFSLLMEIFLGGSKYYFFTWEAMLLFLRGLPQGGGQKRKVFQGQANSWESIFAINHAFLP